MDLNEKKDHIVVWFKELQDQICRELEEEDGLTKFKQDLWDRPEGGGGRTRVISNGNIFEKGGVNFSAVQGPTPQKILEALKLDKAEFFATGVSIVLHPKNPFVPIIHMNVRFFLMSNGVHWFGGGIDLTPHYIENEDAQSFHLALKETCDSYTPSAYEKFKNWADDYFYIKHRKETRGVGGIFFDRLSNSEEIDFEQHWSFVQNVGKTFIPAYLPIVRKNKNKSFTKENKLWQSVRRGRYVEFNLVYDKGTKFGLDTDGRIESILMSMPPQAQWHYNFIPKSGSEEERTLSLLKKGIDWTNM